MKSSNAEFIKSIIKDILAEMDKNKKKAKKEKRDWRLRNTRLLLENYRKLSSHVNESVKEDLDFYAEYTYDPSELDLHTLMKSKVKTTRMMRYFDSIFASYKELCQIEGYAAERRYKIVRRMFIDEQATTADKLAEFFNVDRSTVFRDVNKAIEELSIMLFGIDSFEDLR